MYLKSLTLRGFKSFASATTLAFEPGITCVVGPNGSGKSNVVDALSWVMGEQGAKTLRGGKMEDVIFAGTSGRAPLGRAEVSLTIDNTDGALPVEYTEVTISRTMFRSGGSDYAINGHPARLLDVQELLSDSGIGREMHVIVGQGQLDAILGATPEVRRGFIEEAAGVLKHRKRKEKALRKLESTQANVDRLNDLVAEIRRQLKPLGRQAEVARKAAVIQAEQRDAAARLLADDLTQATLALEADLADERALLAARQRAESELDDARRAEAEAELAVSAAAPRHDRAQETWYSLAGLRERVSTTASIAAERMRHADAQPELGRNSRDPDELDHEATQAREQEAAFRDEVAHLTTALANATRERNDAEIAHAQADAAYASQLRAIADRREGLARLNGQVNSLRSRLSASAEESDRLQLRLAEAETRALEAERQFTKLESGLAGLDAGESGLDEAYESAQDRLDELSEQLGEVRRRETEAAQRRASLAARHDALQVGLTRPDASQELLEHDGVVGQLSQFITVQAGWEVAIAAALGPLADAVATASLDDAVTAITHLRDHDAGRATLLIGREGAEWTARSQLPDPLRWASDVITCDERVRHSVHLALAPYVLVEDLDAALAAHDPAQNLSFVTRAGDVFTPWSLAGGSASEASSIELRAAIEEAADGVTTAQQDLERARFELAALEAQKIDAERDAAAALERLHESDAELNALAEQLGQLRQVARAARDEAARLRTAIDQAAAHRGTDQAALTEAEHRLELASQSRVDADPDPAERDQFGVLARAARQAEMDARLALRTGEERLRAISGRADALCRAAIAERQARDKAVRRAARLRHEAEIAASVATGASWLLARVEASQQLAAMERAEADAERQRADAALVAARQGARERAHHLQKLVEGVHRDEMARIEQRMRIEALTERSWNDLGLDPEVLLAEFGPENFVPVLTRADGSALSDDDQRPDPIPYVREEQAKRLRTAERNLQVLGRVNPLALEEFDAMQERHQFLATQLDDLRRTRKDLLDIVESVDQRVQEVFAAAYVDVEKAFERVFARLFPGGEGRLVLTEPGQWLSTGVDVEARPAGKKVKRLSLLSGGERSLVAVAFLVSLFIARTSPFYILDEVEAALDDTNLGRLLDIYEELRENSQLLVITHQKRTMEIADALYGVTMRGDGVSTVISQRLRQS